MSSRDRGGELGEEIAGQPVMETPSDRDRTVTLVRDISRRTETPERTIGGAQAREEHNVRSLFCLVDVAAPGVAVERRHRLAFPVNEFRADRVVAIPRCWREGTG